MDKFKANHYCKSIPVGFFVILFILPSFAQARGRRPIRDFLFGAPSQNQPSQSYSRPIPQGLSGCQSCRPGPAPTLGEQPSFERPPSSYVQNPPIQESPVGPIPVPIGPGGLPKQRPLNSDSPPVTETLPGAAGAPTPVNGMQGYRIDGNFLIGPEDAFDNDFKNQMLLKKNDTWEQIAKRDNVVYYRKKNGEMGLIERKNIENLIPFLVKSGKFPDQVPVSNSCPPSAGGSKSNVSPGMPAAPGNLAKDVIEVLENLNPECIKKEVLPTVAKFTKGIFPELASIEDSKILEKKMEVLCARRILLTLDKLATYNPALTKIDDEALAKSLSEFFLKEDAKKKQVSLPLATNSQLIEWMGTESEKTRVELKKYCAAVTTKAEKSNVGQNDVVLCKENPPSSSGTRGGGPDGNSDSKPKELPPLKTEKVGGVNKDGAQIPTDDLAAEGIVVLNNKLELVPATGLTYNPENHELIGPYTDNYTVTQPVNPEDKDNNADNRTVTYEWDKDSKKHKSFFVKKDGTKVPTPANFKLNIDGGRIKIKEALDKLPEAPKKVIASSEVQEYPTEGLRMIPPSDQKGFTGPGKEKILIISVGAFSCTSCSKKLSALAKTTEELKKKYDVTLKYYLLTQIDDNMDAAKQFIEGCKEEDPKKILGWCYGYHVDRKKKLEGQLVNKSMDLSIDYLINNSAGKKLSILINDRPRFEFSEGVPPFTFSVRSLPFTLIRHYDQNGRYIKDLYENIDY